MALQFRGKYQLRSAHDGAITCVAFSCSGDYVASGGLDRKLQIFSLADGRLQYSLITPSPIKSLIWLPGTEEMLVTMNLSYFQVYNHTIDFMAVSLPADYLATGAGVDVQIWKGDGRHNWKGLGRLGIPNKCSDNLDQDIILTGLHWSAIGDGNIRLITTYRHHNIHLWDVEKMTLVRLIYTGSPIFGSSLSPKGLLISTAKLGGYDLYSLDSGIPAHTYIHGLPASIDQYPTTFFPSGFAFCAATEDGTVTLWDVKQGDRLQSVQHLPGATINAIAASEKSGAIFLATASRDEVKIWHATPRGRNSAPFEGGVGDRRKYFNYRCCLKHHTFAVWIAALVCVGAILLVPAFWSAK